MFADTKIVVQRYDYFSHQPWFLETSDTDCPKLDTCVFCEPFVEITGRAS